MKPLIVILAICTLGYVADHWQELKERHGMAPTEDTHGLILYTTKSYPASIILEGQLKKEGIAYEKRDLGKEAIAHELTEKLTRVGKMKGSIPMPVVEIDGVLVEGASMKEITRRMH